jgi:hypothetical protein
LAGVGRGHLLRSRRQFLLPGRQLIVRRVTSKKPGDKPAGVRFADGLWLVSFRKYLGSYLAYVEAEQVRLYMQAHHAKTVATEVVAAYEAAVAAGKLPPKVKKGSSNTRHPRTGVNKCQTKSKKRLFALWPPLNPVAKTDTRT